ncbi:MAG: hypothetical protein WC690_06365, partial [bacterium]
SLEKTARAWTPGLIDASVPHHDKINLQVAGEGIALDTKISRCLVITKGPLSAVIQNDEGTHNMLLIGYNQVDGKTDWIFKNSHGIYEDDAGFSKETFNKIGAVALPLGSFVPPKSSSLWPNGFTNKILCVDKDGDGYCNWGISEQRPSACPQTCKGVKDCNDADPKIGPFVSSINLNCVKLQYKGGQVLTL